MVCGPCSTKRRVEKIRFFEDRTLTPRGLIFEEVHRCENHIKNDEDFLDFSAQYLAANKDKTYPNGMLLEHALLRVAFLEKEWANLSRLY